MHPSVPKIAAQDSCQTTSGVDPKVRVSSLSFRQGVESGEHSNRGTIALRMFRDAITAASKNFGKNNY